MEILALASACLDLLLQFRDRGLESCDLFPVGPFSVEPFLPLRLSVFPSSSPFAGLFRVLACAGGGRVASSPSPPPVGRRLVWWLPR